MNKEAFVVALYKIGALKFGNFVLKSGITSPFYINLRDVISYPDIFEGVTDLLAKEIPAGLQFDRISGVPYTGLPLASAVSLKLQKPLIIKRKEEKAYGSKDSIIGSFNAGDTCLLVEDLITSGESIIETKEALEAEGLKIENAVVVIDRSSDGGKQLLAHGIQLHKVITLREVIAILRKNDLLSEDKEKEIISFLEHPVSKKFQTNEQTINPLTEKLTGLIESKKSNLILSLDVETRKEFFIIIEKIGNEIAVLKTHIDIIKDFTPDFITELQEAARTYNFLIFEDRKFADIGNTVKTQYRGGIYRIADWADFVTVHMIAGEAILNGLFNGIENRSSFLLAKMSAKDNLISENYTRKVIDIGTKHRNVVSGFIGHGNSVEEIARLRKKIPQDLLLLMPGVQIAAASDALGQQYISPEMAVLGGADAIIVGRGITHAADVTSAAKQYREEAWNALEKRNQETLLYN